MKVTERLLQLLPGLLTVTVFPEAGLPIVLIFTCCVVPAEVIFTPVNEQLLVIMTGSETLIYPVLDVMLLPPLLDAVRLTV